MKPESRHTITVTRTVTTTIKEDIDLLPWLRQHTISLTTEALGSRPEIHPVKLTYRYDEGSHVLNHYTGLVRSVYLANSNEWRVILTSCGDLPPRPPHVFWRSSFSLLDIPVALITDIKEVQP